MQNNSEMAVFMEVGNLPAHAPKIYRKIVNPVEEWSDEKLLKRFRFDRSGILHISELVRGRLNHVDDGVKRQRKMCRTLIGGQIFVIVFQK